MAKQIVAPPQKNTLSSRVHVRVLLNLMPSRGLCFRLLLEAFFSEAFLGFFWDFVLDFDLDFFLVLKAFRGFA